MSWTCETVQFPGLRAAATDEEYSLHQAALEWSLADPIIINSADDIKSAGSWRDRLKPYEHQVRNLITFCRRLPVTLIADDVGLGKTISAGLILSELMARRRVGRALVLCPKILLPQWEEELLQKFNIESRALTGRPFADELSRSTPVVITTYETARRYFAQLEQARFQLLILDEAHTLRNLYGSSGGPPAFAKQIRDALSKKTFPFVLMLTATPLHNRLWDLYSLVDCLAVATGRSNPFGTPEAFSGRFIADQSFVARRLRPERAEEFRGILSQYLARTRRTEVRLLFPKREVRHLPVRPSQIESRVIEIVREVIQGKNALVQTSIAQAMMSSPEAVLAQLENMARNRTVTQQPADALRSLLVKQTEPTGKLEALRGLIAELRRERPQDWRVVVFTSRKETQRAIGANLSGQGIAVGYISDQSDTANQRAIASFKGDPPQVNVLISTDRGAQGVNLQAANVLVNYDLPWNPMTVEQRIGRIQRLSSKHERVIVCNLVVKGSVEERIVARLMSKLQMIAHAVGDIEAILEAAGCEEDDAGDGSFESQIRDMVLKSLRGQDADAAAAAILASIERAQRAIEEQREEIDQTLGSLEHLHKAGAYPPSLSRVQPSIPLKDFVSRTLTADSVRIEYDVDGTFEIHRKGAGPDLATFDPAVARQASIAGTFGGRQVLLFQPGQPHFERLTQAWCMKSGHRVSDRRAKSPADWRRLAEAWLSTVEGARLEDAKQTAATDQFVGQVMCRVKAVVAHDSYEKLTRHPIGDAALRESGPDNEPGGEVLRTDLVVPDLCPGVETEVRRAVESDPDVTAFCTFYEQRRVEELSLAGQEDRRRQKVNQDFTPKVFSEVVAASGSVYSIAQVEVAYTIDGQGPYTSMIRGIPAIRRVIESPASVKCELSGRSLPSDAVAACGISGRHAAKYLLVKSRESGRMALPQYAVECQSSGWQVLTDEAGSSEVSGKVVRRSLLKPSIVSGRLALSEELAACECTGGLALTTELSVSGVSGKRFRSDEAVTSTDGKWTGHRSEFEQCEHTGDVAPRTEIEVSSVSGKRVLRTLLVTSEGDSNIRALPNEMDVCGATGKRVARSELDVSGVSGRKVCRSLLIPSAKSGVLGLQGEMVVCGRTGRSVTPTECEQCAVTGITADRDELRQSTLSGRWAVPEHVGSCAATGKLALLSELKTCEVSARMFLPSMVEQCGATGKLVDRLLLVRSQASERLALRDAMVKCAKTGKLVLPDELVECEESKMRVLPTELERCVITGDRILRDRLVWSDVSRLPMRRTKAVLSLRGGYCLPTEASTCTWLDGPLLPSQAGVCRLTGLPFATDLLNKDGEFGILREMLDGVRAGDAAPTLLSWLVQSEPKKFGGARMAVSERSPSGHLLVVCVETKAMFGLVTRYAGMLLRNRAPLQLTGRVVEGKRSGQRWSEA